MGLLRRLISTPFTDGENHIPDDVPQEAPTYSDYSKSSNGYQSCPSCGKPGVKSKYKSGGPCIYCGSSSYLK